MFRAIGHKLFFRILFNEEPEILYPRDNLLRSSDGEWSTDKVIRLTENGNSDIPLVEIYLSVKVDNSNGKGLYALLLKHERNNLKHQKNFTKSFYLASKEKLILSAISDGLSKLKKRASVKIYLNSEKLIRVLNQEETINEYSELIENIVEYSCKHQLSFRKIVNPLKNRYYLETEELLIVE